MDDPAVVSSRQQIGQERGAVAARQGEPRPSRVDDAVICGTARKMFGRFTPHQKSQVREVLLAAEACGYSFVWRDVEYVEEAS